MSSLSHRILCWMLWGFAQLKESQASLSHKNNDHNSEHLASAYEEPGAVLSTLHLLTPPGGGTIFRCGAPEIPQCRQWLTESMGPCGSPEWVVASFASQYPQIHKYRMCISRLHGIPEGWETWCVSFPLYPSSIETVWARGRKARCVAVWLLGSWQAEVHSLVLSLTSYVSLDKSWTSEPEFIYQVGTKWAAEYNRENHSLWRRTAWVWIQTVQPTCCVTMDKWLSVFVLHFLIGQMEMTMAQPHRAAGNIEWENT